MQITAAVARERFGAVRHRQLDLADPRPDELLVEIVASGMCQTDQHGRDGYYDTPLSRRFRPRGRRRCGGRRQAVYRLCAPATMWSCPFHGAARAPTAGARWQSHCAEALRSEDARHARRRLDADEPEWRAALQRLLPAIVVRDLRHRQRALRRQSQEGCPARSAWAVGVQRTDRCRRRAQHACSRGPAIPSPYSGSAPSASPA